MEGAGHYLLVLAGGAFLFYLGYGIKGFGLLAERGMRAKFGLLLTVMSFTLWVLCCGIIPKAEPNWKDFDYCLGVIYLVAFPVYYVIWFIRTRKAVYLWTAPAKTPSKPKEENEKRQYAAPIPTNPGTDKIPAWMRVELEKQAQSAQSDITGDNDP